MPTIEGNANYETRTYQRMDFLLEAVWFNAWARKCSDGGQGWVYAGGSLRLYYRDRKFAVVHTPRRVLKSGQGGYRSRPKSQNRDHQVQYELPFGRGTTHSGE